MEAHEAHHQTNQEQAMSASEAVHSTDSPTYVFLGVQMKILLSAGQTGGQFSLIEGVMPPGGDGGLHVHHREDESMHLLEGELEVTIGKRVFTLRAGESYFAPRDVAQRLRNLGAVPARAMLVTTPGGFDEFIARAGLRLIPGEVRPESAPPGPEQFAYLLALANEFGIEILASPEPSAHQASRGARDHPRSGLKTQ
jgi:mannose-6-phosphate isomerase-like protein (cupin superfamily)